MTHVVTSACVDHKYQDCVAVCPVEAFREMDTYLIIDPDECIDCGACVPECPVEAIFADTDVPDDIRDTTRNPFIQDTLNTGRSNKNGTKTDGTVIEKHRLCWVV